MKEQMAQMGLSLFQALLPVLSTGLAALVAWLGKLAAEWIKANVHAKWLQTSMLRLDDAVFAVVREVQQTVVDGMRAAAEDGEITQDEAKAVKDKAIATVKSHLGAKGILDLAKVLGLDTNAIDGLISTKIEAAVGELKKSNPPLPVAPSPTK